MSIKHKLLIIFLTIAFVPMLIIGTVSFLKSSEALKQSTISGLNTAAEFKESELFFYLENLKTRTLDFASDGLVRAAAEPLERSRQQNVDKTLYDVAFFMNLLSTHLKNKKPLDENLIHADVLGMDGKVVASTDAERIGLDQSKEQYFINGKQDVYINDLQIDLDEKHSRIWELEVSAPLRTNNEPSEVIGVLVNRFNSEDLNNMLTGQLTLEMGAVTQLRGIGETGETYIVNQDRLLITDSLFIKDAAFKQIVGTYPVEKCLRENKEVTGIWTDYRGESVVGASMCITVGAFKWVLISEQHETEAFAPIRNLRNLYVIICTITFFLVGLAALATARSISRPVYDLQRGTEIIGNGDLDYRVRTDARDEIGQLSRAFDNMTGRLKIVSASRDELDREINERKQAEVALQASEARTRAIVETAIDGIITIDERGIVESFNTSAVQIFGYTPDEVIGRNIKMLMPEPYHSEHDGYLSNYLRTGDAKIIGMRREAVGQRKDGSTFPLTLGVSEMRPDKKRMFTGLVRDISELKLAEKQLKESQAQIIQSEKMSAVGTMVAGVAHELNNPMMGILNFIQYCIKRTPEDDKRFSVLEDAVRETNRCMEIVQNLLTFSRMEKEGEEGRKQESCAAILDRVFKLLSYRIGILGVSIKQHIADGTPDIWMKVNSIQQVFFNLMGNALDALEGSDKKEIHVDIRPDGEIVRITVSDSGSGIAPENLINIFEAFFTTKPVGKGTGLGLSMCRSIVKAHGGEITCESSPGEGTKFNILLPVERRKKVQEVAYTL